ncbi:MULTISPECIES: PleD family two-component system response regulator [Spirulina sp. CCY15215]|uniref:diguanylate cyclase domain-containing protein n=1 Tax=Spirulina sp. CCY15215 TaxID=2767591 RepID=UPI00194FA256|nr:PleD family two-component system response regulator [Spirulina major]
MSEPFQADILIVDDKPENLRLLDTMLTQEGYKVRKVTTGKMALQVAESARPDLILLDIAMPEMDGYEVCKYLKADAITREIPVIFLSALNLTFNKIQAFEVGGADYITKPFHLSEVQVRINNQLKVRSLTKELLEKNTQLETANRKLQALVNIDGLTEVANRRHFDHCLELEWHRLDREAKPLSLIMSDIDAFKAYNDTYGHQAGDRCLQAVARGISEQLKRPCDLVARYGGEEFVIILPDTDRQGGLVVAESIRSTIQALKITHAHGISEKVVTLSLGLTSLIPRHNLSPSEAIARADKALYEAKTQGKNRVCFQGE